MWWFYFKFSSWNGIDYTDHYFRAVIQCLSRLHQIFSRGTSGKGWSSCGRTGNSTRKNTTIDISLLLILPDFYLTNFLIFAKFLSRRTTCNSFLSVETVPFPHTSVTDPTPCCWCVDLKTQQDFSIQVKKKISQETLNIQIKVPSICIWLPSPNKC